MSFHVKLTRDAVHDLEEIYDYIERRVSSARAQNVLEELEKVFESLSTHQSSGSFPTELHDIGIREYRELLFSPYRITYRVVDEVVYVLVIADGRLDMQTLLQRRLLWGYLCTNSSAVQVDHRPR